FARFDPMTTLSFTPPPAPVLPVAGGLHRPFVSSPNDGESAVYMHRLSERPDQNSGHLRVHPAFSSVSRPIPSHLQAMNGSEWLLQRQEREMVQGRYQDGDRLQPQYGACQPASWPSRSGGQYRT